MDYKLACQLLLPMRFSIIEFKKGNKITTERFFVNRKCGVKEHYI
jgi:hypothetical protein